MEKQNVYEKPVTLGNILKFAVPTIAMTVFMSFYTMVDGLFVSNLIGTNALSAINLTAPVIQLVTAISTMLATGGSAVIMKKMGEGKRGGGGGLYLSDSGECAGWGVHVRGRVYGNRPDIRGDESLGGCGKVLCGIFKPLSAVYDPHSVNE